MNPLDYSIIYSTPRRLTTSAWIGHVPFGMFIVDLVKPSTLVELGTHSGTSYCGFCQAVDERELPTRCYAVDSWQGDPHAEFYGPEILADLRAHHDPLYSSFSTLLPQTFDEALGQFPDASIDLLHLDGYHTYHAARHDFVSWLPKLSDRGVFLLHDIHERQGDFGVWKLWEELKQEYRSFEFLHSHGLGVLAVGRTIPEGLGVLFERPPETVRDLFHRLGARLRAEAELDRLRQDAARDRLNTKRALAKARARRRARRLRRARDAAREERDALHKRLVTIEGSRGWRLHQSVVRLMARSRRARGVRKLSATEGRRGTEEGAQNGAPTS